MTDILKQLNAYLRSKGGDHLPYYEMLDRLVNRVETEKIDERDLIIKALSVLEQTESRQMFSALEIATRNRKPLNEYFHEAMRQAMAQRDALQLIRLKQLKDILDNPPITTRTIDQKTIDLALEVWKVQQEHPNWTLKEVAVKHFGDISEYELIRKATQRVRKASKKSKSVP